MCEYIYKISISDSKNDVFNIKRIKNGFNYRFIVTMKNDKEFIVTKTYYYEFIEELNL